MKPLTNLLILIASILSSCGKTVTQNSNGTYNEADWGVYWGISILMLVCYTLGRVNDKLLNILLIFIFIMWFVVIPLLCIIGT
mgnify:CR=1 FL=1